LSIEVGILSWINETLSRRQAFLGDLPPCPYAAEAVLRGQVQISIIGNESSGPSPSFFEVSEQLKARMQDFHKNNFRVEVVAIPNWKHLSLVEVKYLVQECRDSFFSKDLWVLYDHPLNAEIVQDFSFNHGSLLLFFIQSLSDLVRTSEELEKTKYYDQWPMDYKEKVLGQRTEYYRRFLMLSEPTSQENFAQE
jgi:hypothetical protein